MRSLRFAAPAAVLLCALALGTPAHAQFSSLRETGEATVDATGKIIFKSNTLIFSPVTTFQRAGAKVGTGAQGGNIFSFKANEAGPMLVYEKLYRLDVRPTFKKKEGTSLALGFWYWYHNNNVDRYAAFSKYFVNKSIGAQISIGGDTHTGVNEYYGFLLYNALRPKEKQPIGVQLGIGPYIPRTNLGSSGYTYTVSAAYNATSVVTVLASLWYVNYKAKFQTLGVENTSQTARYTVGVGYSF